MIYKRPEIRYVLQGHEDGWEVIRLNKCNQAWHIAVYSNEQTAEKVRDVLNEGRPHEVTP